MVNNNEQILNFEKQIDLSLDFQIKQLSDLDYKQSVLLNSIKNDIINNIKKEGDLSDLLLNEEELRSIFYEVKNSNSKIFEEIGIYNYYDFLDFIGFSFSNSYFQKEKILFGKKINFILPESNYIPERLKKIEEKNYDLAFKQIESSEYLKDLIDSKTFFKTLGGAIIEFFVLKDGEEIKYTASPEGVYRVERDISKDSFQEWKQLKLDNKREEKKILSDAKNDFGYKISYKIGKYLKYPYIKRNGDIIPREYKYRIDKLFKKQSLEYDIEKNISFRLLYDENTGSIVKEVRKSPMVNFNDFQYIYLDNNGNETSIISYQSSIKNNEICYKGGKIIKEINYYDDGFKKREYDGKFGVEKIYNKNGKLQKEKFVLKDYTDFYSENGERIFRRIRRDLEEKNIMFGVDGNEFSLKPVEMSDEKYLDLLTKNLNTPEKLHYFFEVFMKYTFDSPDPYNPKKEGTKENHGNYVQSAQETINRVENGYMKGDCDDYALLAEEILVRQGKNAYVQVIEGHAFTIWLEQEKNGNWSVSSIGTYGLDKNGTIFGQKVDKQNEKGYPSLKDAINSVMIKFDNEDRKERVNDGKIKVLTGKDEVTEIPIDLLARKDVVDKLVLAKRLGANFFSSNSLLPILNFTKKENLNKFLEIYDKLIIDAPEYIDFFHKSILHILKFNIKDYNYKEKLLKKYIKKYPYKLKYVEDLGIYYLYQSKNFKKAIKIFEEILIKDSSNIYILKKLNESYEKLKEEGKK